MNRRSFIGLLGGGLVTSATMAEAGALAEFMSWLKRKPVWSFPSKRVMMHDEVVEWVAAKMQQAYEELDKQLLIDTFFRPSPLLEHMKRTYPANYSGGSFLQEPFVFSPAQQS